MFKLTLPENPYTGEEYSESPHDCFLEGAESTLASVCKQAEDWLGGECDEFSHRDYGNARYSCQICIRQFMDTLAEVQS